MINNLPLKKSFFFVRKLFMGSYQNLMGFMGFIQWNPIKPNQNPIKILWDSWDSWDLSNEITSNPMGIPVKIYWDSWDSRDLPNEITSNPMEILSKSNEIHGIHGIYTMKSRQILSKSNEITIKIMLSNIAFWGFKSMFNFEVY